MGHSNVSMVLLYYQEYIYIELYIYMLQGGLIALHVATLKQEIFAGLILSSPSAEVDPKVAGWFTVSLIV